MCRSRDRVVVDGVKFDAINRRRNALSRHLFDAGFVFGPMEFSRRDLMAVNIQRGRDHAVSDYNTARKSMGLEPITDVDDYISKTGTQVPREVTIFSSFSATWELVNQLQNDVHRSSRPCSVCTITIRTTWTCGRPVCWRRL